MNPIKQKKEFLTELTPWVLVALLAVLGVGTVKQVIKHRELQKEVKALEVASESMRSENADLEQLLTYIQSSAYTEEQARLRFGLAAPGEKLAIVPRVAGADDDNDKTEGALAGLVGFWSDWWDHFFR